MRTIIFAILTLFVATQAKSEIIVECYEPKGKVFYPMTNNWEDDGITGGKFSVVLINNEWDLLFNDAASVSSARAQGGVVTPIFIGDLRFTIAVVYDGNTEMYSFDLKEKTFYQTQHKMFSEDRRFHKFGTYKGYCS